MNWEIHSDEGISTADCRLGVMCASNCVEFTKKFKDHAKMNNMLPSKNSGQLQFFKQPERLITLFNAELHLGRNGLMSCDKDLLTPMFPLLGTPNEN